MTADRPSPDLVMALQRLGELARLRETLPGTAAIDVSAGLSTADELAAASNRFAASRGRLAEDDRTVVDRTHSALASGWLSSTTVQRLAADPDELRAWLHTAAQIADL